MGESIYSYFANSVSDSISYSINRTNCNGCDENIEKALRATNQICIIESSTSEVEKSIKENDQLREVRKVTIPVMIGGMGVTLLIIILLI